MTAGRLITLQNYYKKGETHACRTCKMAGGGSNSGNGTSDGSQKHFW